ncbi:MAG: hypothetical protein NTZ78_14930 [Candidatus Aureabacteria bacterium]|nr:hypothetical protein [Candidatus Auribacterota bacterium]
MKTTGDTTFNYFADYWTTNNTLNESDTTLTVGSAKYKSFNTLPVTTIRGCVTTPTSNCVQHTFSAAKDSARALFSGAYLAEGVDKDEFVSVFDVSNYHLGEYCAPGFNSDDTLHRRGYCVRWGVAADPEQPAWTLNCYYEDGVLGWGLYDDVGRGASFRPMSSGLPGYGYAVAGNPATNFNTAAWRNSWMWVR